VIVDASVAVKWFVREALHDEARAFLLRPEPLLAPDILAVEFANAMWAKSRRGDLELPAAQRAIAAVTSRGVPELRPSLPHVARATELAHHLDHPVYDCIYLALGERLDERVMTADRRLHAAAIALGDDRVELLAPATS
jgi:predicted nucleic acid-binding protein